MSASFWAWILINSRWFLALHVVSVIMWCAGLLYLPRLLVYHANAKPDSEVSTTLAIMEQRLLRYIMTPALIGVLNFGAILAVATEQYTYTWFKIKVVLVAGLVCVHLMLFRHVICFSRNIRRHSSLYFRILNETVTFFIILIVIMVTVKPFL